jgi:DNA-binding MarR family transcriptional regulator
MIPDHEDRAAEDWQRERPDLDPAPLQVVGRILRLGQLLKRDLDRALEGYELSVPGFSVLAALRRSGHPYALTPTSLSKTVLLTSGAMTNRIDRLERAGLVDRVRSKVDRRSVLVQLTPAGLRRIDQALPAWFESAESAVCLLSTRDEQQIARLLRKLSSKLEVESSAPKTEELA